MRRSLLLLTLCLIACESSSTRFAPIAADLPIPKAPSSQEPSTQHLIGTLPTTQSLSITCMPVDAYGNTTLPSISPQHPLGSYNDDLVCLVTLPPENKQANYQRLRVEIRGEANPTPIVDMAAVARPDGTHSYLVWLPAALWRKAIGSLPSLQLDALVSCEETADTEDNEPCQLQLSQSYPIEQALTPPEEKTTKTKTLAPQLNKLSCYRSNTFGEPEEALTTDAILPLGGVLCALTIENPSDAPIEHAHAELYIDNPTPQTVTTRSIPTLAPKSSATLHLYAPDPGPSPGTLLLRASVGHNPTEHSKNSKSLRVTLRTPTQSQPSSMASDQK